MVQVMVFFPTARLTQLYAETFQVMGFPVLEMHSRKSQAVRTRMSDEFRAGYGLVMFSSDVSARGVDYPDVSLVVQVRGGTTLLLGACRHAMAQGKAQGNSVLCSYDRICIKCMTNMWAEG